MRLTISMQVTLDGIYRADGGNNDWMDPGFTRGGWATSFDDRDALAHILGTALAAHVRNLRGRGH